MGDFHSPPDLARAINDIKNRISALERRPAILVGEGAPSSLMRGQVYLDELNDKLYAMTDAGLRSVSLT